MATQSHKKRLKLFYYLFCCAAAWIQVIATAPTISLSLQSLDRSLTGFLPVPGGWGHKLQLWQASGNLVCDISSVQVRKNEDIGFDEVLQFSTIFLYFR
jgi:hypothetical protein